MKFEKFDNDEVWRGQLLNSAIGLVKRVGAHYPRPKYYAEESAYRYRAGDKHIHKAWSDVCHVHSDYEPGREWPEAW